jgi:hypothetical protein
MKQTVGIERPASCFSQESNEINAFVQLARKSARWQKISYLCPIATKLIAAIAQRTPV